MDSNKFHGGVFSQNAGKLAGGIVVDFASCGIWGLWRDACGGKGGGVGDGDVSVDADQHGRMAVRDGIDIGSVWVEWRSSKGCGPIPRR